MLLEALPTLEPPVTALIVGLAVGLVHYIGHSLAGEARYFEKAGVMVAGIAVSIGATIATYLVLVAGGVA